MEGWLFWYRKMLELGHDKPAMSESDEVHRHKADSEKEMLGFLLGNEDSRKFRDIVESCSSHEREEVIRVVAYQLQTLGVVVRVLQLFLQVRTLVSASRVDVWLVDEGKKQIMLWAPGNRSKRIKSFCKEEVEADYTLSAAERLCQPIRHQGVVVALVECHDKIAPSHLQDRKAKFSTMDHLLLQAVCDQGGMLFHRINTLLQTIQVVDRALKSHILLGPNSCSPMDLYRLVTIQFSRIRDILNATTCVVYMLTDESSPQKCLWTRRQDECEDLLQVSLGTGVVGWVAESEEAILLDEPQKSRKFDRLVDTAYSPATTSVQSLMVMPIRSEDGPLLGTCSMINKAKVTGNFNDSDKRFLENCIRQISVSISGMKTHQLELLLTR
ncbi:hypothetical protein GUITHDRAFT_134182 [Guillardia theta CCMP2712]|uniref:GAF domain-containing protein n=1 Tax=Guillardia theta (strain CCMP2712) TaxID=905079 RepID=L1JUI3_GUITC|nr:hypothetical protein GUITHDRAFT_134182 [Guillardia theta CCMP2712]EKX51840.1 hypothetical protein GUITHDRAFT_134182 [Guillardia theta CCMP2712]|eukprot:XP_005838820.1 hypothetical protein GUITHDRAFT_134182 [Guillardia theta CCMP2712]